MMIADSNLLGLIFVALYCVLFVGTVGLIARDQWQQARDRRYLRVLSRGICPICGYDLRASKDRCPECNNPTALVSPAENRPVPPWSYRIGVPVVACLCFGVLILALFPPNPGRAEDPMVKLAKAEIAGISTALEAFRVDTGRYPTEHEGLQALITAPPGLAGWKSAYLDKMPMDPWKHPYIYHEGVRYEGGYATLSAGPDGREGTKDDIPPP
jgi:general secretion pathway protein G